MIDISRASILAVFAASLTLAPYALWRAMFPTVNPVLGGFTGLLGIGVWLSLGLLTMRQTGRRRKWLTSM